MKRQQRKPILGNSMPSPSYEKHRIPTSTGPRTIGLERRNQHKRSYARSVNKVEWRRLGLLQKTLDRACAIRERAITRQAHRLDFLHRRLLVRTQQAMERAQAEAAVVRRPWREGGGNAALGSSTTKTKSVRWCHGLSVKLEPLAENPASRQKTVFRDEERDSYFPRLGASMQQSGAMQRINVHRDPTHGFNYRGQYGARLRMVSTQREEAASQAPLPPVDQSTQITRDSMLFPQRPSPAQLHLQALSFRDPERHPQGRWVRYPNGLQEKE